MIDAPGAAPAAAPGGRLPVLASMALIAVAVSRIHELFPALSVVRPLLLLTGVTVALSVLGGRLNLERIRESREAKVVILFWLFCMVTIPFAVYRSGAFNTWLYSLTVNVLIFLCCAMNSRSREDFPVIFAGIALSTAGLVLGAVRGTSTPDGRFSVTASYDPNDLAMVLVCSIPFLVAFLIHGKPSVKLAMVVLIGGSILLILRTASRGGFLGLAACGGLLLVAPGRVVRPGLKGFLILAGVVLVIIANPEDLWTRFSEVISGTDYNFDTEAPGGRIQTWKQGFGLVKDHFFTGVGVGQFATGMGQVYGNQSWITAHNSFLQVLVELGVPGFLIYLAILLGTWRNLQKAIAAAKPAGGITYTRGFCLRISFFLYILCGFFLSHGYSLVLLNLCALSGSLARIARDEAAVPGDPPIPATEHREPVLAGIPGSDARG